MLHITPSLSDSRPLLESLDMPVGVPQHQAGSEGLDVHIRKKSFLVGKTPVTVHQNLRFRVDRGQFVTLLGPSGCGKSTLLRMIAGLDLDFDGSIELGGTAVVGPGRDRGIVFQDSRLLPWLTVQANIAFALPRALPHRERLRRLAWALKAVGLYRFRRASPSELSGGMAKRVALARALVNTPRLLLLDEPFGALDTRTRFALHDQVRQVHERERIMTLMVTHDVDEAIYLSDVVAVLTPTPASVRRVFPITLPDGRDRASGAFAQQRETLLAELFRPFP